MGLPHGRLTDVGVGICCCHPPIPCIGMTGILVTASPNVYCNTLGSARLTDIMLGACGHIGIMVTGSTTVYTNGLPEVRLTDFFTGCFTGIVVTGSGNTFTGG